ncbi:MAG: hypothetical protein KF819_23745 [Labilithrix sp.]|nr:hypothetical protein [Labilithrix sp.]
MIADRLLPLVGAVLLAATTGCAGARSNLTADRASYPVSLSRAVRDADGDIVAQDRTKKVASFRHDTSSVAIFYSYGGAPKKDISKAINDQIAAHGGDAIVNLRVTVKQCGLNFVPLLYLIPIWPGCAKIETEGDIIKVAPKAAPAPEVPGAAIASREVTP